MSVRKIRTKDKICGRCKLRNQAACDYYCYPCLAALKAEWRARNPEKTKAQRNKDQAKRKARLLAERELANSESE